MQREKSERERLLSAGMMTVKEAAAFLGVSKTVLYNLQEKGALAYCKFGTARRIPRQAVIDMADSCLTGGWAAERVR